MLTTSSSTDRSKSTNLPPKLRSRTVPIPGNSLLSTRGGDSDADSIRSSKLGNCAMIPRTCKRVILSISIAKEVTDCGSLQNEDPRNSGSPPSPNKLNFSTFVNHRVYSEHFSRAQLSSSIQTRKSLTRGAGLSSGIGNVLAHLSALLEVKLMTRKRRCRHG